MEEAKRRDHRVLGKKLDLFSLQEDAGGGLVRSCIACVRRRVFGGVMTEEDDCLLKVHEICTTQKSKNKDIFW